MNRKGSGLDEVKRSSFRAWALDPSFFYFVGNSDNLEFVLLYLFEFILPFVFAATSDFMEIGKDKHWKLSKLGLCLNAVKLITVPPPVKSRPCLKVPVFSFVSSRSLLAKQLAWQRFFFLLAEDEKKKLFKRLKTTASKLLHALMITL